MKKSFLSAFVFFGTLIALSVGYAAWNSPFTMNTVGSGSGLTVSGWNALVNNINDLDARLTALTTPQGTLQYVQNNCTTTATYAGSATRPGTEIAALTTSITTKAANSSIVYDGILNGETHYNNVFILERVVNGVVTELGSPSSAGSRTYGMAPMTYDNDIATTMAQIYFQFIDTPNVPSGTVITYRLRFYGYASYLLSLNRTVSDTDDAANERTSSNIRLEEFKP